MIRLAREPLAPQLAERLREWREQLLRILVEGRDPTEFILARYRNPELKAVLKVESSEKCIYCESKITHTYHGDVEHILPKSRFPERALDHDNLGFACALCNNGKGAYWEQALAILDPYIDDPSDELFAFGPALMPRPGKHRARVTIRQLALNRMALIERRLARVERLRPLIDEFFAARPGPLRNLALLEIVEEAVDAREFALVVRTLLQEHQIQAE